MQAMIDEKQSKIQDQIDRIQKDVSLKLGVEIRKDDIDNIGQIEKRFQEIVKTTDKLAQISTKMNSLFTTIK